MDAGASSLDKKIYRILRTCSDAPRVLFRTPFPLLLERHNTRKSVLLVCTKFYSYLIKVKGCSLYTRWPNRSLTVTAENEKVTISSVAQGDSAYTGPSPSSEKGSEFLNVVLVADSATEASGMEYSLTLLIHSARRTAALLEEEERGGGGGAAAMGNGRADTAVEDEDDAADMDSSGSDAREGDAVHMLGATARAAAVQAGDKGRQGVGTEAGGLIHMAPSRYIAITSLVDGEFADYTTLKNAYLRKEEESLLSDLATFIKENEGQVEALCEHHYPAFIHAAQQCLAISEKDAQLVGEELSGATALVRSSVVSMKQVAAHLVASRNTRGNLAQVRTMLSRCIAISEYLHTTEMQVQKQQLFGAVRSLKELARLAASLAEFALGEYVLHVRVPVLAKEVFWYATQHLHAWLKLLREQARPLGMAALSWKGRVVAGYTSKAVVVAEEGNYWWLTESFHEATISMLSFTESEAIRLVSNGAAIQTVFVELRYGEYFCRCYTEGRAKQSAADLFDPPRATSGVPSEELVLRFEEYCVTALGFLLVEDVVYASTSPHAQSSAELLHTWDRVSDAIAERARTLSQSLMADPQYTTFMLRVFKVMRDCVHIASDNVKSVELNPIVLARVVETLSDTLVSWWLQDACMVCTETIFGDLLTPLTVTDAAAFDASASRFYLNKCSLLELPMPTAYISGAMDLPYSTIVPTVGEQALHFLERCYSVIEIDAAAAVQQSEVNNVDSMLLKYLSVLFRTIAETLNGKLRSLGPRSIVPHAVLVTTCSVMPVLVSCVEQQFMLRWQGDYSGGRVQELGSPKLLAPSAAFFNKPIQTGIEGLLTAYIGEVENRLKSTATFAYWTRQVELRNTETRKKAGEEEGFGECMDHAMALVIQLQRILQSTVLRSVVGTVMAHAGMAMQAGIETALMTAYRDGERDFTKMRSCLVEFEAQCAMLVPLWQSRLKELLPGITAGERFPLNARSVVADLTQWLEPREAQYTVDRAAQPQLFVGIGDATKAVTRGFQAMGKNMASRANALSRKD